ncbi:MAG: hypothetical protein ACF8MF_06815 [Phycisphaerales bacterium JB052]
MFQHITKEVMLDRGFVDKEGKAHRRVVLRPPTVDDEVTRDAELASIRHSNDGPDSRRFEGFSDTLSTMALIKQCIVTWDHLPKPELYHLRSLSRADGRKIVKAFYDVEEEDEKHQLGNETSPE